VLLSIPGVYKRKHLTRKRKVNKKIIITNRQRGHKGHSSKIQSVEEEDIISSKDLSKSSKLLLFISLQIVQKMQVGTIFHTAALLGLPENHQHANKSITRLGITQDIPKRLKRTLYKAEATSQ
jgi:hypothetical protein